MATLASLVQWNASLLHAHCHTYLKSVMLLDLPCQRHCLLKSCPSTCWSAPLRIHACPFTAQIAARARYVVPCLQTIISKIGRVLKNTGRFGFMVFVLSRFCILVCFQDNQPKSPKQERNLNLSFFLTVVRSFYLFYQHFFNIHDLFDSLLVFLVASVLGPQNSECLGCLFRYFDGRAFTL